MQVQVPSLGSARPSFMPTSQDRLRLLFVSQMPASPPHFGAQVRMHGLMTQLARRHDVTAVMLVDEEFDLDECRRAMQAYCREAVLIRNPHGRGGLKKRLLQLQSLTAPHSFERHRLRVPELQQALDRVLTSTQFDIVNLEFPFLGHFNLRQAPPGCTPPLIVVDAHNIEYDLARQYGRAGGSLAHRMYHAVNWPKLQLEEIKTYCEADGVYLCSSADEQRLRADAPHAHTAVIPNAADVEYFRPRPSDPKPDGRTVVFFGLLSYVPNVDGLLHFVRDVWPRIVEAHPEARLKIIGNRAPQSIIELAGPSIELAGFVSDLRPHLASAAAVVVPLRLGGGTRLKIVEAMAMGKAIVSTSRGAEGIEAVAGRDILIADEPNAFADAVSRLLAEPGEAANIGHSARRLAEQKYSWSGAVEALERFYRDALERRRY